MADPFGIIASSTSPLAGVSPEAASRILQSQQFGMGQALNTLMQLEKMEQSSALQTQKLTAEKEATAATLAQKAEQARLDRESREAIAAGQQQTQRNIAAAKNLTAMKKLALEQAKFSTKEDVFASIPSEMTIETVGGTMPMEQYARLADMGAAPDVLEPEMKIFSTFANPAGEVVAVGVQNGELFTKSLDEMKGFKRQAERETVQLSPKERTMQTEEAKAQARFLRADYADEVKERAFEGNIKLKLNYMSKDPDKRTEAKGALRSEVIKDIANAWKINTNDVKFATDPKTGKTGFWRKDPATGAAIYVTGDI